MPQQVFRRLRRGVGHVGKQPEGRHVSKKAAIRPAEVAGAEHAAAGRRGDLRQILRQVQVPGKIVSGPGGDVPECRPGLLRDAHQAGHSFIQRPVAAAAHHPVITRAGRRRLYGVAMALGGVGGDLIASLGKYVQNIGKAVPDPLPPGVSIVYK